MTGRRQRSRPAPGTGRQRPRLEQHRRGDVHLRRQVRPRGSRRRTRSPRGPHQPVSGEATDAPATPPAATPGSTSTETAPVIGGTALDRRPTPAAGTTTSHGDLRLRRPALKHLRVLSCPHPGRGRRPVSRSPPSTPPTTPRPPSPGISVDTTAPNFAGRRPRRRTAGWYRGDVIGHWTATTPLGRRRHPGRHRRSSVKARTSRPPPASRTTPATRPRPRSGVGSTAPRPKAPPPRPARGWQSGAVTVTLHGDGQPLGGGGHLLHRRRRGSAGRQGVVLIAAEGTHAVAYWSIDRAGNTETARTATVLVDQANH